MLLIALGYDFTSVPTAAIQKHLLPLLQISLQVLATSLDGRKLIVDESASGIITGTAEAVSAGYGIMSATAVYSAVAGMKSYNQQQGNAEGANAGKSGEKSSEYMEQLDDFSQNKINHIINGSKGSNHHWEKLVPDRNWNDIKNIINNVYGEWRRRVI